MIRQNINRNRPGIALVTVIMVLLFMLILTGLVLNLLSRGAGILGSSRRYLSIFEAAESGIELAMINIEIAARQGTAVDDSPAGVDGRTVELTIEHIFTGTVAGANIVFGGTGYEGVGTGISSGGTAIFYRIESDAEGPVAEQAVIETAYRKIVGIGAH